MLSFVIIYFKGVNIMVFPQKSRLNICMTALNISARELAKAIYVDYTLVSKWNNSKRMLSRRSVHLKKIVDYLISIDNLLEQKILRTILEENFGKMELENSENFEGLLSFYLTEPNIKKIQNKDKHINEYKVYLGNKERREAVTQLLDLVLSSDSTKQLLLVSQEDMSWLTEDREFLNIWEQKLKQVLLNGNKIKIIHWVDRHPDSLASIYSKWLPMHLSGNLESFYMPLYSEIKQKQTLFIVKDEVALIGNCIDDNPLTRYTASFYDSVSVKHYERVYLSMLLNCLKLFEDYGKNNSNDFWSMLLRYCTKHDNSCIIADTPFLISLPPEILKPILIENDVDEATMEKCLVFSRNINEYSENKYTKYILSFDKMEQLSKKERFLSLELTYFIGKDIYITNLYYKKQLSYLADKLKVDKNYEVCLLRDMQKSKILSVNLCVLQNSVVIGWADSPPFAVSVSEPTLVSAAFQFFSVVWGSIPRVNRERTDAINALLTLIKD